MRKFKIDYIGGAWVLLVATLFSVTVVLIPLALLLLLRNIEIREAESNEQTRPLMP